MSQVPTTTVEQCGNQAINLRNALMAYPLSMDYINASVEALHFLAREACYYLMQGNIAEATNWATAHQFWGFAEDQGVYRPSTEQAVRQEPGV